MKRKAIFLAVASLFTEAALAQALPTGGAVTRGSGSIGTAGSAMTVTQTSQRAIFDFTTYNIGAGASVTYAQPGASAVAVSRVPLSAGRSQIDGTLSANGHIMLLNPNGVLFGSSAVVNVGSLTASTGTINDDAFMAAATSIAIAGATTGSIENRGTISASGAGLVAFVAPSVANSGIIAAEGGRIVLAGAQTATLTLNGGLYEIAVGAGVAGGSVSNTGMLAATGGTIILSAPEVESVVSGAINLSGIQRANRIEVHGKEVVLSSDLDATAVAGSSGRIEVRHGAQLQDAVAIAKSDGADIEVHGGAYSGEVTLSRTNLTVSGRDGATLQVAAGERGFNITADGVTVEGMKIVGPYGQPFTLVAWNSVPTTTAGVTLQPNVNNATIRDNDIRNVRTGVQILGTTTGTSVTGNTIDNTKGSVLLRSGGVTVSGNKPGVQGNEWDVVLLNNVADGAYFTSPHADQKQYGADMMAMSAANGGMRILDRRYGSNGLLGSTPQFGNRSHIVVSAGSSFTAADDFDLGNGLGNARQPLGFIADGLNAAVHGGYVDVLKGTYVQTATLAVSRPVTLRGAGQSGENATIIDARGVTPATGSYGMKVTADGVSLSDFTFYGPSLDAGGSYGIKVQPRDGVVTSRLRNFTIRDVTSRGAGRAELDLHAVVGATIDGVTAIGTPVGAAAGTMTKGAGIQITDSEDVVIRNSTTRDNAWGGVALYQANRFYDQQMGNVRVESSNSLNEVNPLYMQDESASRDFGALDLQGFAYAVRNPQTSGGVTQSQYTWLQKELQGAYDFAVDKVLNPATSYIQGWSGSAPTQDFYVGVGNLQASGTGTFSMSIGQAVSAAAAGATVHVGAGTYRETLAIARPVTIDGAGSGQTILRAATAGSGDAVTVNGASDVTLSDVAIADYNYGLRINGTSHNATLERVAFTNNKYAVRTATTTKADNFRMLSSSITGGTIGVQTYNSYTLVAGVPVATGSFANALFENVTVDGASFKGFYFETANNLTLRNVTVTNSGNAGDDLHRYGHAVDVNLKFAAFDSITFDNLVVRDSGSSSGDASRAAVVVKTRGVPGDSSTYTAAPASLQAVSITGGSIEGSQGVGIRFEDLSNGAGGKPTVTVGGGMTFRNNGQDLVVGTADVNAAGAIFADAANGFAIEDRVTHALDASGRGLVTWQSGHAFVTAGSGSVQRAVDAASAGDTIHVANVDFTEDVVVGTRRNLLFNDSQIGSLSILCTACSSGIGGSVKASGTTGFQFSAPVVLLADTVLDTSASARPVSASAIDGASAGGQKLTIRAGAGLVTLGNLGATTRLGTTNVTGAAIHFTGAEYDASSLSFSGPMTLHSATTSFLTNGGNIVLNGDIQNAGGSPAALTLDAGSGDVTLVSGGSSVNPLGRLEVDANNFSLQGTLWVSGYDIDALGSVALSNSTLRSVGGGGTDVIDAGGDVSGSTTSQSSVQIGAGGDVAANVAALGEVVVEAASISGTYVAPTISFQATETINVTVDTPGPVQVKSPDGFVNGNFGELINTGDSPIHANGRPQLNPTLAETASNNRVVPQEITTAASAEASAPQGGGSTVRRRRRPEDALDMLENGEAIEIDLTPG